jgi:hypothetical protein
MCHTDTLGQMVVVGVDGGDHAGAAVPAQAVAQHIGHQAVAVRDERLLAAGTLLKGHDDHLQEVQAAVNELGLVQRAVSCLQRS